MKLANTAATCLYVDASNVYGGLVEILPLGCYLDFGEILACIREDFVVNRIKAYGTYLSDEPLASLARRKLIGAQQKFFQTIRDIPEAEFIKGYLSPTSRKEKGIDVKMAVDMVKDAYDSTSLTALIMTGDDDFLYPVICLRNMNIKVHLVALGSRLPYGTAHNTNQRVVYDLNDYFISRVLPRLKKPIINLQVRNLTNRVRVLSV